MLNNDTLNMAKKFMTSFAPYGIGVIIYCLKNLSYILTLKPYITSNLKRD